MLNKLQRTVTLPSLFSWFDIGGIGLNIFIGQPALLALEGFGFTPEPLAGIFQRLFQLLDILSQRLVFWWK